MKQVECVDGWVMLIARNDGTEFVAADLPGPGRAQLPNMRTLYLTRLLGMR